MTNERVIALRTLSDYEKDDRESELQIAAFKRLAAKRQQQAALAIANDAGSGP